MLHYYHFFFIQPQAQLDPAWRSLEPGGDWLGLLYVQGVYAVNVFWMISGFVFAHVYCGRAVSTPEFAAHRIARLYPLHLLTLGVVALLQAIAMWRLGYFLIYTHNDWQHFVQHVLFVPGWGIDKQSGFNAPIWSVSVELLVYALFWSIRGWLDRIGAAGALALAIAAGLLIIAGQTWLALACAFNFFIGVALAFAWRNLKSRPRSAPLLGGVLLASGVPLLQSSSEAVSIGLGLPAFFGGLMLLLVAFEARAEPALRRAAQWLGDATYSVYLWHVPMQIALILALTGRADLMGLASQGWFLALWLAAVLTVGRLSFTHFEAPARRVVRRLLLRAAKGGDRRAAFA